MAARPTVHFSTPSRPYMPPRSTRNQSFHPPGPYMPPRSARNHRSHSSVTYYASSRAESLRYTGIPPSMTDGLPISSPRTSLPPEDRVKPADRGKDAWLFLLAAFLVEAVVWGFPFSFGIFQNYYRTNEPFAGSSGIANIGTCSLGVSYLGFPFMVLFQRLYPRAARFGPVVGLVGISVTLVATSFATTVPHLIVTQGILYATAAITCYSPCMLYLDEWFIARKGLAFGILWSGTGTGGFVTPLLMEILLRKYGFQTALRIWAIGILLVTMPLVYFIKPRLPIGSSSTHTKTYKWTFLLDRTFLLYQFANMAESIGFFLPLVYLPTYARAALGASPSLATLTVMLINASAAIGMTGMGWLTDKYAVQTCLAISTVATSLAIFLIWGFASNLVMLYAFCVVYGLFASSFSAIWPAMARHVMANAQEVADKYTSKVKKTSNPYDPVMLIAFLNAGRGASNIASGPVSELLIKSELWKGEAAGAWGSGYGLLVLFTGLTAVLGGSTILWKRLGWMDRL